MSENTVVKPRTDGSTTNHAGERATEPARDASDGETTRADSPAEADPPRTRTIARTVDVDAEELRTFVEFHPDPSADDVLALSEGVTDDDLDVSDRRMVERWVARVRERPDPTAGVVPWLETETESSTDTDDDSRTLWSTIVDDGRFEANDE